MTHQNLPRTVRIGDVLQLLDGDHSITSYSDGVFRLRNEFTNQYHLVDHIELRRMLPPETAVDVAAPEPPALSLDETLDGLDEKARFLVPHLQELLDGTPASGGEPQPKYAPEVPTETKLMSKVAELATIGQPVSLGTLKRRFLNYRRSGVASLRDGRKSRPQTPFARADGKVLEALAELIPSYAGKSSPTYTRIRADLRMALFAKYPDADERPTVPSLKSVERYVRQLSKGQDPTRPARERETAALSPQRQFRPRRVSGPGDECQADSTLFDALVRFPDGTIGRPYLTILVDKRTRSIVASHFSQTTPTGYDHAVMLAKALVPRPLRSWAKYYEEFGVPDMPWSAHLEPAQLEQFDTRRPYIFPRRITIDNGKDYRGLVFRLACERYGIHLTEAPPKSPTTKAQVERTFNTIKTKFAQYLPGYLSGNVQNRGHKAGSESVLDLALVEELFERWVAIIWQNRKHDGLFDPDEPGTRHTPNTMFVASIGTFGHFVLAYEEDDFIALMPSVSRTIQADGVEFNSRMYDSPHLNAMRLRKTRDGNSAKVAVHYDPGDKRRVWVRADDGEWITCEWSEQDGFSRPLEREYSDAVRQVTAENPGFTNDEVDDLTLRLLSDAVAEDETRKQAERSAAEAAAKEQRLKDVSVAHIIQPAGKNNDDFEDFLDLAAG